MRPSTPTLTSDRELLSPLDDLAEKVLDIIFITKTGVQAEVEILKRTCQNLEDEVRGITARRDMMAQDLGREREWIRLLEMTLKTHAISFPPYPFV
jgi:hypothetical protein